MAHLSDEEIERYLSGRLDLGAFLEAARHLLEGCVRCGNRIAGRARAILEEDEVPEEAPVPEAAYDKTLRRVLRAVPKLESAARQDVQGLSRSLDFLRWGGHDLTPGEVESLWSWPLCDELLRRSFEARYRDPGRMLELAQMALSVSERASFEFYGSAFLNDLQARVYAELANALRVNERFDEAERALARAGRLLFGGTGDVLLVARVTDVEASLRSSQRRLDESLDLLDQTHRLYLEAGDRHLAGRALVSRAINLHYRGDARTAAGLLREALALLDPGRDAQLVSSARLSILYALADSGEAREASRLLLEGGLRQAFAEEPLNLLKLRWIEGKILAGLGKLGRAERVFAEVRGEMTRRGQHYDAALVGLDLAAVWLRRGKAAEVRELAGEMLEIFRFLEIHSQAELALAILDRACRMAVVSPGLVDRVRAFLVRLQNEPWLQLAPDFAV